MGLIIIKLSADQVGVFDSLRVIIFDLWKACLNQYVMKLLNSFLLFIVVLGGGGGGFFSSGRSSTQFGGSMGNGGEGGKGFLQGGVGGRAWYNNAVGGFGGGGGAYGNGGGAGGGGDYSGGSSGRISMTPVEEGEDLTTLERISRMNAVTIQLDMVK